MIKPAAILACGLAVLAGCSTTPRKVGKPGHTVAGHPPDWEMTPKEQPAPPPPVVPPQPETVTSPPPTLAPHATWISLNRWREQQGIREMRRLPVKTQTSFALPSTNGVLIVSIGSRTAYWDGMEIRLGFAPQVMDGQVYVHALDAQKNFEPLLQGAAVQAKSNRVVVIDPGHGGSNLGARSVVDGRLEKDLTLDLAKRLAPLLEAAGWQVFLTRVNDVEISLPDRVAFAERVHADLFLSLHFNSLDGGSHEQGGLETYCLTPAGLPSNLVRGYPDDPAQVFPNNAYDDQNFLYAVRLHRALLGVNGDLDRGVRRARFPGVLRGQKCPAVLIEAGYLTNSREARRIADPAHRQKLAGAIAKALE